MKNYSDLVKYFLQKKYSSKREFILDLHKNISIIKANNK